jgi:hypothetical protein
VKVARNKGTATNRNQRHRTRWQSNEKITEQSKLLPIKAKSNNQTSAVSTGCVYQRKMKNAAKPAITLARMNLRFVMEKCLSNANAA